MSGLDGQEPPQVPHWMHRSRCDSPGVAATTLSKNVGARAWVVVVSIWTSNVKWLFNSQIRFQGVEYIGVIAKKNQDNHAWANHNRALDEIHPIM